MAYRRGGIFRSRFIAPQSQRASETLSKPVVTPIILAFEAGAVDLVSTTADNATISLPVTAANAVGQERLVIVGGRTSSDGAAVVDFDACTIDGQVATRVGTISRATAVTGTNYVVVSGDTSSVTTVNFGTSAFTGTAPSGFTAWGSGTTLNPSDKKDTSVVLSGGDLTVTGGSTNSWVRSTTAQTGKKYLEFTATTVANTVVGVADPTTIATYPGANVHSFGLFSNGFGAIGGAFPNWSMPYVSTNLVCMAVDFTAQLVWFRVGAAGNWNASATANPATGTEGLSISAYASAYTAFVTAYRAPGTANTSINVALTANNVAAATITGVFASCWKMSYAGTLLAQTSSAAYDPTLSANTIANGAVAAGLYGYGSAAFAGSGTGVPVFRAVATTTYGSNSSTTVSKPTGTVDGDIMLAAIFIGAGGSAPGVVTPPAGWTQIGTRTDVTDGGFYGALYAFWKRASSEGADYIFAHSTASTQAEILSYSSCVASGDPVDTYAVTFGNTNNNHIDDASGQFWVDFTGVTTTSANTELVLLAHNWDGTGALVAPSLTTNYSSVMTERFDGLVYAADEDRVSAAATATRSMSMASGGPFAGYMIALKPLAAAGSGATVWTGLTERFDNTTSTSVVFSTASAEIASASTPLVISADVTPDLLAATTPTGVTASLALSFNPVNVSVGGYSLPAIADSYVVGGTATGTLLGRKVAAEATSYAMTGTAQTLKLGWFLVAEAASYAVTGTNASLNPSSGSIASLVFDATDTDSGTGVAGGGSTVAIGSTSELAYGSRTNSTVTAPTGISNGHLLLAFVAAGDAGDQTPPTVTPPAGFTAATGSPFSMLYAADLSYGSALNVFWKIAASEAGDYTFTHSAANSQAIMYRVTGASATTPLNPAITTAAHTGGSATGKQATAPSLTTATDNSLIIYAAHLWDGGPGTQPAGTTPTFTERVDSGVLYIADGVLAAAGATGSKVNATDFSAQSTDSPWRALLVAVSGSGASTYTFPLTVAASSGERLVVVGGLAGTDGDFSAVSIDGNNATRVGTVSRGVADSSGYTPFLTAFRASGTANTSINVVATIGGSLKTQTAAYCACFNMTGASTTLKSAINSTANDPTLSTDTASRGTVVAALLGYADTTPTVAWTGLTERFDLSTGTDVFSGASADITSGESPRTISADITPNLATAGADSVASLAIAFNPAGAAANMLAAAVGTYALTGTNPGTLRGRKTVAGGSSYAVTGTDASTLKLTGVISAGNSSYTVTGTDPAIIKTGVGTKTIVAEAGSYSILNPAVVNLKRGRKASVTTVGSYVITGTTVTTGKGLISLGGSYALTGTPITLTKRTLPGYISISVSSPTLTASVNSLLLVRGTAGVFVSGVGNVATVSVSNVSVGTSGGISVLVTGNSMTASVSNVSVAILGGHSVDVTGNEMTASVGTAEAVIPGRIDATMEGMTASVGTVMVDRAGSVNVQPFGNYMTSDVGTVSVETDANVDVTGEAMTASVGDVTAGAIVSVDVTGPTTMTASVGDVSVTAKQVVSVEVTGNAMQSYVGRLRFVGGGTVVLFPDTTKEGQMLRPSNWMGG